MIYTVGEKTSFEAGFKKEEETGVSFKKLGSQYLKGQGHYKGGAVFETRSAAQAFADAHPAENWGVYGVDADWEKCTVQYDGEEFRRLVMNRSLLRLED